MKSAPPPLADRITQLGVKRGRFAVSSLVVMALVMTALQLAGLASAPQAAAQTAPPGESSSCTAIPQEDDLVAWWTFDDTYQDKAATFAAGVPENGATLAAGYVGPSLDVTTDGAVQYTGVNLGLDESNGGFSVDMWVRSDSASGGVETLLDHRDASFGVDTEGFALFLYNNGVPHIRLSNGTTAVNYGAPTLVLPADGEFHLLTYVVTAAGDITFYVDDQSETISTGRAGPRNATGQLMSFGSNIEGTINHFDGMLDEIEIFNTLLTAEDVDMLLNARRSGKCGFTPPPAVCTAIPQEDSLVAWWNFEDDYWDETGAYVGVPQAGSTIGTDGYVNTGLDVTAPGHVGVQSANLGLDESNGGFSVDLWVRSDSASPGVETLLDHRDSSSGSEGFSLFLYANGVPHIQLWNGSSIQNFGAPTLVLPADGQFHLLTYVVTAGGDVTFYVDDQSETISTGFATSRNAPAELMSFGSNVEGTINHFDGMLDEIEIFNTLLTAEDVDMLLAARDAGKCGLTPPPVTTIVDLPDNVIIGTSSGENNNTISYDEETELIYLGCAGGTVTYEFRMGAVNGTPGALLSSGTLTEVAPGQYETAVPPTQPLWGDATLSLTVVCPEGGGGTITGSVYIDPSGVILNQLGYLIEGATVELLRSDDAAGPFTMVPDGSTIMSPANRSNPVVTGADGFYRWDTMPGFYKTRVTAPGCSNPADGSAAVESAVLPVPPIQVDIDLVMQCRLDITCTGVAVTIDLNADRPGTPTDGPDVILGTDLADTIDGLGGKDIICGEGGDDTIIGGPGNDKLFGHRGNDVLDGGAGDDTLHGNKGDDTMSGGPGDDRMFGYADNDTMNGGLGNDRMHGNFGDDIMDGGPGNDGVFGYGDNDIMNGGLGNDTMSGNFGDDEMNGGDGDDRMFGSGGADLVNGNAGDDEVSGNSGPDVITGGAGDDLLDGGIQSDTCGGGPGTDQAGRCETEVGIEQSQSGQLIF